MRVFAVIYIALGILYHLVSSPNAFAWSDPWLYVTIGLWPIFLLGWVAIAFGICYVGYILYDKYKAYTSLTPEMKMKRKKIAERRKEVAEKVEKQRQEQAAEREKNSRPTNPTELH
jgi:hypothetical protein